MLCDGSATDVSDNVDGVESIDGIGDVVVATSEALVVFAASSVVGSAVVVEAEASVFSASELVDVLEVDTTLVVVTGPASAIVVAG